MNRIILGGLCVVVLASCAKRPDAIAPTAFPSTAYANTSCGELESLLREERTKLDALSASQNQAATNDAIGVFLIGIPASSIAGGDWEGLIAVSKGKVQAIEAARLEKGC